MRTEDSKLIEDNETRVGNFLSEFVENIRESLGVEPSTSPDQCDDDCNSNSGHLESALSDRLNQDQVQICCCCCKGSRCVFHTFEVKKLYFKIDKNIFLIVHF